jgi:hypothetical protein
LAIPWEGHGRDVVPHESLRVPKRLRQRWRPDSIREFRAAARQRFDDGLELAGRGRRTGAIYLWGYSAEMTLKAAYFALTGVASATALTLKTDITPAINRGKTTHRIAWATHGQGHDVRSWAELLVLERAALPGKAYPVEIGRHVQLCGQRIGAHWSESLRYHKNVAYEFEMRQVREAAEWLLANSEIL